MLLHVTEALNIYSLTETIKFYIFNQLSFTKHWKQQITTKKLRCKNWNPILHFYIFNWLWMQNVSFITPQKNDRTTSIQRMMITGKSLFDDIKQIMG